MRLVTAIGSAVLASAVCSAGALAFPATDRGEDVELAAPIGFTFHAARGGDIRLGDSNGMTLYIFDGDNEAGASACSGECAEAWPPMVAREGEGAVGAWNTIQRADGTLQWTYHGKPLYRSVRDQKIGDAKGDADDRSNKEDETVKDWHAATLAPAAGVQVPPAFSAQELSTAAGWGFVTDDGNVLYTYDADPAGGHPVCVDTACANTWHPVAAGQLTLPVGDFGVIARDDGIRQWTFKGKPLYTFAGDTAPGDTLGNGYKGEGRVALIARYFMPDEVALWHNHFGGTNIATTDGMTLYMRIRGGYSNGFSLREGVSGSASVGRGLGTGSCDAECVQTWPVLNAPDDAVASGYFEIFTREDGTKQWGFKGYPLYTYMEDTKPGDMEGYISYKFLPKGEEMEMVATAGGANPIRGATALIWVAAVP